MNYASFSPPICIECGDRVDYEPEHDLYCNPCWFRAEAEAQRQRVLDFRNNANEWLRCSMCHGTGEYRDGYCRCHVGEAAHDAEAKRFAFVKSLPALAVCGAEWMADAGIDPQTRIGK
jgi:hypothetical protein